jgi:hypothetical protein
VNSIHLGDALDHWKGALLSCLDREGVFDRLVAEPMLTDPSNWREDDFTLYARLLQIAPDRVLRHAVTLKADRDTYFGEIRHRYDIFLDPDVGVATYCVGDRAKYILPRELEEMLHGSRLIAVYQHFRAAKVDRRLKTIVTHFPQGSSWASYGSPTVAMLLLSRDASRIRAAVEALRRSFGRHAKRLVCTNVNADVHVPPDEDAPTMPTDLIRLLNSIGKEVFVQYFDLFQNSQVSTGEVVGKLPSKYTEKSRRSRTSKARRIIREGLAREALAIIAESDRVDVAAARRARELLRTV